MALNREQPGTAEVVIIGGGLVGMSTAYHLSQLGLRDVVVLERAELGSGSTGKNAGGLRHQFSSALNVRLSRESLAMMARMPDELGTSASFKQVGYLFLATREADLAQFRRDVEIQQGFGVPVRLVDAREAAEIVPGLTVDDVLGGTFCPIDGHGDPGAVLQGYASGARRAGVQVLEETPVTAIHIDGGRVAGVSTPRGRIATRRVLIAAGAWSGDVGRLAGLDIPIVPIKRQIFVTGRFPGQPAHPPLTIDFATGFYFHGEGEGLLFGIGEANEQPDPSTDLDWSKLPRLVEHAIHRLPVMEAADVRHGWAGLYEVTPDHNALVGWLDEVDGLAINAGYSGHGFQHSPITGKLTAQLLAGQTPEIDLAELSPARFKLGAAVRGGEARFV